MSWTKCLLRRVCISWLVYLHALLVGCAGASGGGGTLGRSEQPRNSPVAFAFDSLDARPVTSESLKGKPSVLAFVTTWDLPSQAQVAFLSAMAKSDGAHAPSVDGVSDKANYVVIALDGGKNRELVEVYAKALQVPFPVAHADADTIAGKGAFGDLQVPTVIIVDEFSIPTFRKSGVSKPDEIRAVLRSIGQRNRLRGPE